MSFRFISLLLLIASILSACLPAAGAPSPLPSDVQPVPSASPSQAPVPGGQDLGSPAAPPAGWVEYRDQYYGYGIALPCYWTVYPTPGKGAFAAMSARSYSDAFFAANSERGEWKGGAPPAGALKLDVVAIEAAESTLRGEEAIRALFATPGFASEQELVSVESKAFGSSQGYLVTVKGGMQGAGISRSVYFELSPGILLVFAAQPSEALDAPDMQAIINSLAPTPSDAVTLPAVAPSGPPAGDSVSCQ